MKSILILTIISMMLLVCIANAEVQFDSDCHIQPRNRCPINKPGTVGVCVIACDGYCPDGKVCCSTACGGRVCMKPRNCPFIHYD